MFYSSPGLFPLLTARCRRALQTSKPTVEEFRMKGVFFFYFTVELSEIDGLSKLRAEDRHQTKGPDLSP